MGSVSRLRRVFKLLIQKRFSRQQQWYSFFSRQGADAFFWVGKGRPSPSGIRVPDENGGLLPLKEYDKKTIVLTLPEGTTVYDVDYLSVWCKEFAVNFADVAIPSNLNVPPSLRMLGVEPQRSSYPSPPSAGKPKSRAKAYYASEEHYEQPTQYRSSPVRPAPQPYVHASTYHPPLASYTEAPQTYDPREVPTVSLRTHGARPPSYTPQRKEAYHAHSPVAPPLPPSHYASYRPAEEQVYEQPAGPTGPSGIYDGYSGEDSRGAYVEDSREHGDDRYVDPHRSNSGRYTDDRHGSNSAQYVDTRGSTSGRYVEHTRGSNPDRYVDSRGSLSSRYSEESYQSSPESYVQTYSRGSSNEDERYRSSSKSKSYSNDVHRPSRTVIEDSRSGSSSTGGHLTDPRGNSQYASFGTAPSTYIPTSENSNSIHKNTKPVSQSFGSSTYNSPSTSTRSKSPTGLTSLIRSQNSNSYSIDTGVSRSSFTIYS